MLDILDIILEEYKKANKDASITKKSISLFLASYEKALVRVVQEEAEKVLKETGEKEVKGTKGKAYNGPLGAYIISKRKERKLNLPTKSGNTMAPAALVLSLRVSKTMKNLLKDVMTISPKK